MNAEQISKLFDDNADQVAAELVEYTPRMSKERFIEVINKLIRGKCNFSIGEYAIVFNEKEWSVLGDKDNNEIFYQKAKIINLRYTTEWLADVEFVKSGIKSNGHFVRCMNKI